MMPMVTMRLFAEERLSCTIELLLSYPVRDGAVLVGKYLGALTLYALMLAGTLLYPALLLVFRAQPEWGSLATGYLGLLLMGAMFLAVGVFASSLTESQIVAGLGTWCILLMFWAVRWPADFVGGWLGTVLTRMAGL